jgi:hypothetical protein
MSCHTRVADVHVGCSSVWSMYQLENVIHCGYSLGVVTAVQPCIQTAIGQF